MSDHPAIVRRAGAFDFGAHFGLLRLDVQRVVLDPGAPLQAPGWLGGGERLVWVLTGALRVDGAHQMTAGTVLGLTSAVVAPPLTAAEPSEVVLLREWCRPLGAASATSAQPRFWRELEGPDDARYAGSEEVLSIGAPLAPAFGLWRLGVHHERLPSGRRTSEPHAEESEEEFALVLAGTPSVWLDGTVFQLAPGDAVGFPAGAGVAHTMLNDSDAEVRLLVVGEASRSRGRIHYPLNAALNAGLGARWWSNAPQRLMGPHDGRPRGITAS